jgi:hypothetical protein
MMPTPDDHQSGGFDNVEQRVRIPLDHNAPHPRENLSIAQWIALYEIDRIIHASYEFLLGSPALSVPFLRVAELAVGRASILDW